MLLFKGKIDQTYTDHTCQSFHRYLYYITRDDMFILKDTIWNWLTDPKALWTPLIMAPHNTRINTVGSLAGRFELLQVFAPRKLHRTHARLIHPYHKSWMNNKSMDIAWHPNVWILEEVICNLFNNLGGFLSSEKLNIYNYYNYLFLNKYTI